MRRLVGVFVAATAAVAALTACSPSGPAPSVDPNAIPQDVRLIQPTSAFSAKTISDWKSLGDAIVIAEVTTSREDDSTVSADNPGVYGRLITVAVLNTMWSRDAAHTPPATFDMNAWGWVQHGNAKQAIVAKGEPRLETNHVYLLALARFTTGWSTLGDGAEVPFDNGIVGQGEWEGRVDGDNQPALDALMGKNLTEAQDVINAAQPDPRSVSLAGLDPQERAQKLGKTSG